MTNEEHIKNLETIGYDGWTVTEEAYKSLQYAITVLKQEPILDKIRAEIDRQYKWLINTRYTIHDVDIAFDSIYQTIEKCRKE